MKKYLLITLVCFESVEAFTQWEPMSYINNMISDTIYDQKSPQIATDNNGGAIIVWEDFRLDTTNTSFADIYVQRIDSGGYINWTIKGKNICANDSDQGKVQIIADGAGGAFVAWHDHRNGDRDIYAQHINSNGVIQWISFPDGVPVSEKPFDQRDPKMAEDGSGGVIIIWQDSSSIGNQWDIYAQHLDNNGNPLWAANGIPIVSYSCNDKNPRLRSDDAGGAIITWQSHLGINHDILAKRIDGFGNTVWGNQIICGQIVPRGQHNPRIVRDGKGGAIIAWEDKRNIANTLNDSIFDLYAQRVNASGIPQWSPANEGIAICIAVNSQDTFDMAYDGEYGAILAWEDNRFNNKDIFAQKIDSSGSAKWGWNGIQITTSFSEQESPAVISDGAGGAIIAFKDSANGSDDIMSSKIDAFGNIVWTSPVGTAPGKQKRPRIVTDGRGGCIYTFEDKRDTTDWDIYAYHLYWNGTTNGIKEEHNLFMSKCFPNPFSSSAIIEFDAPNNLKTEFSVFDLLGTKIEIPFTVSQNKITVFRSSLPNGIYVYEINFDNTAVSKGKLILTN